MDVYYFFKAFIFQNLLNFSCCRQFESLAPILKLPGKKTFNNMDREFLEKRKKDLNAYLQVGQNQLFIFEGQVLRRPRCAESSVCLLATAES